MRSVAVIMVLGFGGCIKAAAATTETQFQQQPLRLRVPACARDCANRFLLSDISYSVGDRCTNTTAIARDYEECLDAQSQGCFAVHDTPPSAHAVIDLLCPPQLNKRNGCIQDCPEPTTCGACPHGQTCVLSSSSCIACATMECRPDDPSQLDSSSSSGGGSGSGSGGKKLTTLGIAAICIVCVLGVLLVIVFFIWGIRRQKTRTAGARRGRKRTTKNSQPLDQVAVQQLMAQQQQREAILREAAMKESALVGAAGAPANDEHAKKPLPGPWQKEVMWKAEALKKVAVGSPKLGRVAGTTHTSPMVVAVHSVERKPLPGRQKSTFGPAEEERAWIRASEMERECQREEVNLMKPPKAVWC